MKKWQCSVCGYIHDGESAPDKCPKCGAPKEKFVELNDQQAELVERSRYSNQLHAELLVLMDQIMGVAEAGIEDDLDPGCVAIFKNALEQARVIQQAVKAELKIHMNKGKWG